MKHVCLTYNREKCDSRNQTKQNIPIICHSNRGKLNGYKRYEKIEHEMSHVVWNAFTKESFDRNWNHFLMKYGIFLIFSKLFKDRHLWILYDNCLRSKEQRERESNAADFHTVIPCAIKLSIEAQNSMCILTRSSGKSKNDLEKCELHLKINACCSRLYEQIFDSTFNKFPVTYDVLSSKIKCQCLLFESRGILCRHSLSALSFERVNKVSPRYILERWNKNVKRRHTHIKSSHNKPLLEPRSRRFDNLELTEILHLTYVNAMVEMQEHKAKKKRKMSLSHNDASLKDINKFQNPP
ncbi:hypothetical protein Ahy_A08g037879 [Arachis hypogaea]|uniref:Protein FAR1-RELATED SEQUENCE n=1 Tax=Arachis hypogaea TaxID=3818 RepID=A0A445BS13_ARAHY|nr:hypothetical protein Ahy_A08g037879 [Arachis hypogaea]